MHDAPRLGPLLHAQVSSSAILVHFGIDYDIADWTRSVLDQANI